MNRYDLMRNMYGLDKKNTHVLICGWDEESFGLSSNGGLMQSIGFLYA
jgi:hypothetical protein